MKKKSLFEYAQDLFDQVVDGPVGDEDHQLEDFYESVRSFAAVLSTFRDFNVREDFYEALRNL